MLKKILTGAVALSILAGAGAASAAQPYQNNRDHRGQGGYSQSDNNQWERNAPRRYQAGRYQAPRGYQARHWRRGERLPTNYRSRAYYVDYRAYHLAPPPRGYQYTRVGNDVVLTAIASGLIASVILGMFNN